MKREDVVEQLEGNCEVEVSIGCDTKGCKERETIWGHDDPNLACEEFYTMGWRVDKDGFAICPKCVRKAILKRKNNE